MSETTRLLAKLEKSRWISYMPRGRRSKASEELTIGERAVLLTALLRRGTGDD